LGVGRSAFSGGPVVKNLRRLRIQQVSDFKDKCCICGEIKMGCHFDHDLASSNQGRGQVCDECSGFVIISECLLIDSGFVAPTDPFQPA
jgi:hypothetical protein